LFFGGIRGWAHVPYDFGDDGKGETSFSIFTVCGEHGKVFEVNGTGFDAFLASTFSKEA
jgi:hypothetical protein